DYRFNGDDRCGSRRSAPSVRCSSRRRPPRRRRGRSPNGGGRGRSRLSPVCDESPSRRVRAARTRGAVQQPLERGNGHRRAEISVRVGRNDGATGGSSSVFHDGGDVDGAGEAVSTAAGTSTARTRLTAISRGRRSDRAGEVSKRINLFGGDLLRILAEQLGYGWDGAGSAIVE